ncbi:SEC59/DGK1/VTE5 family protein [Methanothermobacter sp. DP]|uniref:diacylglycerol/polyprenol kinase family protein n=1 Tax=Methanothermobacter sp. DP TaxID=2998972 RepID=UPI002AA587F5|nr:SEC59/DGK1/VTE5 family protein [Methanothermobacter sp. DP]
MSGSDILGLLMVYLYVAVLLIVSERLLGDRPNLSRKFVHIMVGNILFILPLFDSRMVITFLAAAPFIPLTFLISPYSPLKIKHRASSYGHGLGLVYYSMSWTVLAYLFFNTPWVTGIGIAAMSYGDGLASLIGERFGRTTFSVLGDRKSLEGSLGMFLTLIVTLPVVLLYYSQNIAPLVIVGVALVSTLLEALTPRGLDNLTACFGAVAAYLILGGVAV